VLAFAGALLANANPRITMQTAGNTRIFRETTKKEGCRIEIPSGDDFPGVSS
jgi:hypothetical protein